MVVGSVRSALLVQPSINPPGGGNAVAAWMLRALQDDHQVALLCWEPPDIASINRFFGTKLSLDAVEVLRLPAKLQHAIDTLPMSLYLLKTAILCRYARKLALDYDVVLSANNEVSVGRACIQYVHYPRFLFPRPSIDAHWYNAPSLLRRLYYSACTELGDLRVDSFQRNLTLVNSEYIGKLLREHYSNQNGGLSTTVLYPPCTEGFPATAWEGRQDQLLTIGRISAEKRTLDAVEVVRRLRALGHSLRLHIAGTNDDDDYYQRVVSTARQHDWIVIHENLSRSELGTLATSCRYGVHCMPGEHFGMAVAEMQSAGCLTFAHGVGGCTEIIREPQLVFDDIDDAVRKIARVFESPALQTQLRQRQRVLSQEFTSEQFCSRFRRLVSEFCTQRQPSANDPRQN